MNENEDQSQLIFLELNEINFDFVRKYIGEGLLPEFKKLIDGHGIKETVSEDIYQNIEPWIQWVTAHTGLDYDQHKVFRLGDIQDTPLQQVWETLEAKGVSVAAVSPMNALNRTKRAKFFIPDPWTNSKVTGSFLLKKMYAAISDAVNENAKSRLSPGALFWLLLGAVAYARIGNYLSYIKLALGARKKPWLKAMFLDLLLSDVFIKLTKKHRPQFSSLFVNAGAHIQHHYLFSSSAYEGDQSNPSWYLEDRYDPIKDVYTLYDQVIGEVRRQFPGARLMIATALHQDPHPKLTYYWRLRDHERFLSSIGVPYASVHPRMSRDFLVTCDDSEVAKTAQRRLEHAVASDGQQLFEVDNRGTELFVMLIYPSEIGPSTRFSIDGESFSGLRDEVAFVAIKNGQHNGIGYFLDTQTAPSETIHKFPLKQVHERVINAF